MPLYETTVVIDSTLEESLVNEKVQGIVNLLTEAGACDIRQDRRGARRLAYEIKGKDGQMRAQADYTFLFYEAPGGAVKELETHLRLDEDILRFMTVRYEHIPPAAKGSPAIGTDDDEGGASDESEG